VIEKFTITKTRRWGNAHTEVGVVAVLMRNAGHNSDSAIRVANEMISKETPYTNEEYEMEVMHTTENGDVNTIHTVEKKGALSI
jgi:hypothetical protein